MVKLAPQMASPAALHSGMDDQLLIGPVLPLAIVKSPNVIETADVDRTDQDEVLVEHGSSSVDVDVQPNNCYGPALPPPIQRNDQKDQVVVGPTLPKWFKVTSTVADANSSDSEADSDDSDVDEIGPMPMMAAGVESTDASISSAQRDIERRARMMKDKLTNKGGSEELKREEWMTVLPPELSKNFGLGSRTFQRRTPKPTGDRSVWTDTPSDRIEKEKDGQNSTIADVGETDADILARRAQQKYDGEMEKITAEHNKAKRADSLLLIHKKDLKRKAGKEQTKSERRPFDRDVDLKVNAMDEAKRKALIKQSRQLNDKFSSGKSQFL